MMIAILLLLSGLVPAAHAADKPAYQIYRPDGSLVSYEQMLGASLDGEIVMFGELHNNPIAHWLQLELARDLHADSLRILRIGFEMFEADQQVLLDEYASGKISQSSFEREARLWNNYATDYKPVVEFAKANGIPMVAGNIPRRYASLVYSGGLESLEGLTDDAKRWIAPLPVEVDLSLPGYAEIMTSAQGHGGENLPKSQAVKDATMAHFILQYHVSGDRFLHLNGSYHSDNREGVVWYLLRSKPNLEIVTITTIEADDVAQVPAERLGKADFTIVVPSRMTKTY